MRLRRVAGMVMGGLGLSMCLYAGLTWQASRATPATPTSAPGAPIAASLTPVTIGEVTEGRENGLAVLRLTGQAEAGGVVVVTDRGERVRQVRVADSGEWTASLPIPQNAPMAVEAELFDEGEDQDASRGLRGDQTVFRIHRAADREAGRPPLVMVGAPAAPTRIVSSPFGGLPGDGPLYLGAIDYDDSGGVIVSGLCEVPGRVRVYVAGTAIGETRIGPDGRWAFIAPTVLPLGASEVRAELQPERRSDPRSVVSVTLRRLPPLADADGEEGGALSVAFEPSLWQVRRALLGGGVQSTVVFAPE